MKNNPKPEDILKIVFGYAARISKERKLDSLLLLMADMGRELTFADRCTLWIYDKREDKLWSKVAHGMDQIGITTDSGLVSYSVRNCESLIIDDAYSDKRFNKQIDGITGYRTKAMIVIPITSTEGEVIGAYQAINKMTPQGKFTKKDIEYLTLASSYAEKVIESAGLYEEIETTQKKLIMLLGKVSVRKSWETGSHLYRVAEYSKLMAMEYGLDDNETELLYLTSPMHDIGKIAIDDKILQKPTSLTEEEFNIIKTHTQIGYELLGDSGRPIFKAASIIAYEHHEKWDGTGYPRGLTGEEIHIFGRITAIADVFDALSHDRCYKKAWAKDQVTDYILQEKGLYFEPKLVDIFFDNIEKLYNIKNIYTDVDNA